MRVLEIYYADDEAYERLGIDKEDPISFFDENSDYMYENWEYCWAFFIDKEADSIYVSDDICNYDIEALREFGEGQSCIVTKSGNSTRDETEHWKYEDEMSNKGLEILYRNGCGMFYTVFKYINK